MRTHVLLAATALLGGGCADLFGLDEVELDATTSATSTADASTSTSSAGGAGGADGTGAGGAGGSGGDPSAAGGAGGEGGDPTCDVGVAGTFADGTFVAGLGSWTTTDLEVGTCDGACSTTVQGDAPSLAHARELAVANAACLRFTLGARGEQDVLATPFVRGRGVLVEAPPLALSAAASAEDDVESLCRLPAGFDTVDAGFTFADTAAPLPAGAPLDIHHARIEILASCPDRAPRCVSPGRALSWDAPIEDVVLETSFASAGEDGWTPEQGTWECGDDGCTIRSPNAASQVARSVPGLAFPAGSCLALRVDATAEDEDGATRAAIGTSIGTAMTSPEIPIGEDTSVTCRVPHDVTVDVVAASFLVDEDSAVALRELGISRLASCPCDTPACEPAPADGCPRESSCIDPEAAPTDGSVYPEEAAEGIVAGFADRKALRLDLGEGDGGVSLDDAAFTPPAGACVEPVLRARTATSSSEAVGIYVEDYSLGARIQWPFVVESDAYRPLTGTPCAIPALFSAQLLALASNQGADGVLDVDRIELRPAEGCASECDVTAISADACSPPPADNQVPPIEEVSLLDQSWVPMDVTATFVGIDSCDGEGYFRLSDPGPNADLRAPVQGSSPGGSPCLRASLWARTSAESATIRPLVTLYDAAQRHEAAALTVTSSSFAFFDVACALQDPAPGTDSSVFELETDFPAGETLDVDAVWMGIVACSGGEVQCL